MDVDPATPFQPVAGPSGIRTPNATPSVVPTPTRMSTRPRMPSVAGREVQTLAEAAAAKLNPSPVQSESFFDRATRSKTKPKFAPKLKLKLGEKTTQVTGTSFLGPYDRELDSDDEDLVFEEQFILKMPEGEDCENLRAMVHARNVTGDVWFKFKDSRRGLFHIGDNTYAAKLVDLPSIIESQKTLDNKQMFKIADICQMLVVGDKVENGEEPAANSKTFDVSDFLWPHGITPPMKWARKRRFRKRMSRAAIEIVEQEVDRLLMEDSRASEVQYDVLENVNPDLSDGEFEPDKRQELDLEFGDQVGTPDPMDLLTPAAAGEDGEAEDEEAEGGEDGSDDDLAAELERALAGDDGDEDQEDDDEDDEEDEEDEDESGEEEEEDEDTELTQARRLLDEEIRDLEAAVSKKVSEIASSGNPLIKRRFEDALKKLKADLESKLLQRASLTAGPIQEQEEANDNEIDGDDIDDLFDDGDEEEDEGAAGAPEAAPEGNQGDEAPMDEDGVAGAETGASNADPAQSTASGDTSAVATGPRVIQLG
ncbi:hypothetical protein FRC03_006785 [Tulasnella sp. 419]|nr:hypothetical protein FRC02_005945 [Tulasnella sp. 418]KAG8960303.1 hypothetical protein FRC03_006785 [Tulasnella sp. 419]